MSLKKSRAYSVVYMFIISALFAGLISGIKVATASKVADNKKIAATKNIVKVFELMPDEETDKASGATLERTLAGRVNKYRVVPGDAAKMIEPIPLNEDSKDYTIWVLLDEGRNPEAFAFPIGGRGFWGPVLGIMCVNAADGKTIRTVVWTKHGETPGLGARIEEKQYREKFRGKLASHPSEERFTVVPEGTMGSDPHKIDQITGATQTTVVGMGQFLNDNFSQWHMVLPLLKTYLAQEAKKPKVKMDPNFVKAKGTDG